MLVCWYAACLLALLCGPVEAKGQVGRASGRSASTVFRAFEAGGTCRRVDDRARVRWRVMSAWHDDVTSERSGEALGMACVLRYESSDNLEIECLGQSTTLQEPAPPVRQHALSLFVVLLVDADL
jgi:hypothetical protein